MAKSRKKNTPVAPPVTKVYNITRLPHDHSAKTLSDWATARQAAEDLYAPVRFGLYELYRNIALDTHLTAVLDNQRILATTSIPWTCTDTSGNPVEGLEAVMDTTFFERLITYIIESRFYGHSLIQIDWQAQKVELVPRGYVNPQSKLVLPNPLNPLNGVAYNEPPYNYLTIEVGEPEDLGLLLKVAPWVILKRGDIEDWATFCEIFGMPMRVAYYDASSPQSLQATDDAMKNMGAAGYLVLPDGSRIEFPDSGSKQGNDVFDRFARFCDQQISKAIVAQTMTTEDGSSQSQATVHLEIQDRVFAADRKLVAHVLNEQLIPLIIAQGGAIPEGARFTAIDEEEELTAKERLDMDLRIHKEVGRLPKAYFAEEYNVEFVDASDDEQQPQDNPTPEQKPKKKAKKEELALQLDDIPLHDQPFFIRLFELLKGFFANAPK